MTRLPITFATLLLSTSAAFAGPVEVPPVLPPVVVPADEPFEGFYAGLEYGIVRGDVTRTDLLVTPFPIVYESEGNAWGGFAGYNFQNGAMVFGGEVRMLHFQGVENAGFQFEDVIDVRARLGFAATEDLLLYAALGYSTASAVAGGVDVDLDGYNIGGGVEYNVTDRWFIGADVTTRDVEGATPAFSYDGSLNTATLRVGFRF